MILPKDRDPRFITIRRRLARRRASTVGGRLPAGAFADRKEGRRGKP